MRGKLSPAVLAAALAEAERQRAELIAASVPGKVADRAGHARRTLAQLPDFAERFKRLIGSVFDTKDVERLARAREATRALVVGGRVPLAPTPRRDALCGEVRLYGLGEHALELGARPDGRIHYQSASGAGF